MQLLRITTIPIKMKMNKEDAKIQLDQRKPQMMQRTVRGKLSLKQQNIKVRIDTYEARMRMGQLNIGDSAREAADRGVEGAMDATAEYAELGNKLALAYKGVTVPDAAYSKLVREPASRKVFLPSVGAQLAWEGGTAESAYEPVEVHTEWDTGSADMVFVPGELKFEVEQYPDIQIEYTGSPNYVPPSANPEYEGEK